MKDKKVWIWIVFFIYTLMSATGLFLIKTGTDNSSLAIHGGLLNIQMSTKLIIGFLVYIASFLLSLFVMSRLKLSLFYPVGTGVVLILTSLSGYFLLGEKIGFSQLIGMALILAGIVAMNAWQ